MISRQSARLAGHHFPHLVKKDPEHAPDDVAQASLAAVTDCAVVGKLPIVSGTATILRKGPVMEQIFGLSPALVSLTVAVTLFAAFVKGAVGFAMPMIMISGFSSFLAPEMALAALIIPTVLTNVFQASRDGLRAVWDGIVKYRRYLAAMLTMILASAQLVSVIPSWLMFLLLGVPITIYTVTQILGLVTFIPPHLRARAEIVVGAFAGAVGGISGVWGPPTALYLTAIETPKREQVRVQGMIFGTGAVVLLVAHLQSGILNAATAPLSAMLVIPALIGMGVGLLVQDKMDQARFRTATMWVLMVAGLNLIRRGVAGM